MTAASPLARIVLMTSALAAGLMPFVGDRAAACSCVPFTKTELAAQSETVFTGRPLQRVGLVGSTIRFEVDLVYKGALGRTADLQVVGDLGRSDVSTIGAGCGIVLETGRRYTIFARDHDGDGVPNTNGCFQNVEGDIDPAAYGLLAPRPIRSPDGAAQLAVVAGVLALVGLVAVAVARSARARGAGP